MKPVIGVTSDYNGGDRPEFGGREETCYIRSRYLRAVEETGGAPVVLSPVDDPSKTAPSILDRIDGLLLTGSGPDIDPALYGERRRFPFRKMSSKRSDFEIALVRRAIRKGIPILGICGGMQILNVAGGGSLYQDIPKQVSNALPHQQGKKRCHFIQIEKGTLLSRLLKRTRLKVNSAHHQGVKRAAPGYVVNAVAEDGVIEGIEAAGYPFVLGVQWHPEYLHAEDQSRDIFKAFLKMATRYRRRGSIG